MGNVCCGGKPEGTKSSALLTNNNDATNQEISDRNGSGFDSQQQSSSNSTIGLNGGRKNASVNDVSSTNQNNNSNDSNNLQQLNSNNTNNDLKVDNDEYIALREEQARLEMIVQGTGRGMVSVRSTRGSTGYYDQGFAAALWQHLEQNKSSILQTATSPLKVKKLPGNITSSSDDNKGTLAVTTSNPEDIRSSIATVVIENKTVTKETDPKSSSDLIYSILCQPMWDNIYLTDSNKQPTLLLIDQIAESYLDEISPNQENLFTNSGPIVESLL